MTDELNNSVTPEADPQPSGPAGKNETGYGTEAPSAADLQSQASDTQFAEVQGPDESIRQPEQLSDEEREARDAAEDEGDEAKWYVIHTYSGYENKVKETLEQIVENRDLTAFIKDISVPMEEVVEVKDGKRKTSMKKIYPGYVLVKMVLNDEIWYIVRNTRGVTGFVGPNSRPVPLTEEELAMMGMEANWEPVVDYGVGDSVKVINGPLESFIGTVDAISTEKKKVRVMVSMFGRETPVELDFTQVIRL
ncbi:transcription termination/antitermination protein NusG [Oscillospiraceae bacterium HV4-5-C5C]|nr:transcription termination/antitermination protein NusG [Oscillospiraceae bacterium HV4-5-C5C]